MLEEDPRLRGRGKDSFTPTPVASGVQERQVQSFSGLSRSSRWESWVVIASLMSLFIFF